MQKADINIVNIINSENYDELPVLFAHMNAADIAEVLEHAEERQSITAFRLLDEDISAEVFSYFPPVYQQLILEGLTDTEVEEIMEELPMDEVVDFIEEAPEDMSKRVLESVSPEKGELIDRILDYPDDSVGSVMTTEVIELSAGMTVNEALHTIRTSGVDNETIYTCYVIDQDKKLIGVVTAGELLYARTSDRVGDIMHKNVISANASDDREQMSNQFSKYDFLAMPVVNRGGQLVGVVTADDILRIMHEEDTEDFEKMVGILNPTDEPYLKTSVLKHARHRIMWLLVLMIAAALAGAIISTFEDAMTVMPVLVVFFPMLMGAGGNAGAQASTVVIRGMALGEIETKDVFKLLWSETRIALICSVVLGVANFVRIFVMYDQNTTLALVVTFSLCITLLVAKSIGCVLPVMAKRFKMDPSIMAAPMITTIVDCTALIVFFAFARMAFSL